MIKPLLVTCLVFPDAAGRGGGTNIRRLVEAMAPRRPIIVLCGRRHPDESERESGPGFEVYRAGPPLGLLLERFNPLAVLKTAWACYRLGKKLLPETEGPIMAHYVLPTGLWARGLAPKRRPLVMMAHGSDLLVLPQKGGLMRRQIQWVLRGCARLAVVSENLREAALSLGYHGRNIALIPVGTSFPPVTLPKPSHAGPVRLLHTRSLAGIYDPLTLIRALGRLAEAGLDFRADLAGDGPLRPAVEAEIARLGIAERVTLHGHLAAEPLCELYAQADLYLSCSRSDGTPVTLLEAMISGCYPIVSDIAANRDWLGADDARFFPVGDDAALAEAVVTTLADDLSGALQRNLARVVSRGTLDASAATSWDLLDALLSPGPSPRKQGEGNLG